jgi:hypothetical protein
MDESEVKVTLDAHTASMRVMGATLIRMQLEAWEQCAAIWECVARLTKPGQAQEAMLDNSKRFFASATKLKTENERADVRALENLYEQGPKTDV